MLFKCIVLGNENAYLGVFWRIWMIVDQWIIIMLDDINWKDRIKNANSGLFCKLYYWVGLKCLTCRKVTMKYNLEMEIKFNHIFPRHSTSLK